MVGIMMMLIDWNHWAKWNMGVQVIRNHKVGGPGALFVQDHGARASLHAASMCTRRICVQQSAQSAERT